MKTNSDDGHVLLGSRNSFPTSHRNRNVADDIDVSETLSGDYFL